ncbi:MAG: CHRD domain-containing protein [Granulosicoccus sp.]|nr:CHRD domain-containing protein [Granulosicoccus sp.]
MKTPRSRSCRSTAITCILASSLLIAGCSDDDDEEPVNSADTVSVVVPLTVAETNPPATAEGASGEANFDFNTVTGAVSGSLVVSGTTGQPTMAHIHSGDANSTGPVVITLVGNADGSVWTAPADATLDTAQLALFDAGELYFNVHTEANSTGELRGQIINPATAATDFLVRVENVSTEATLTTTEGSVAVPLSPGAYLIHQETFNPLLEPRDPAGTALEQLAEDGNPAQFPTDVPGSVVFDTPVGASEAGPIGPGEAYEFTVAASPGDRLSLVTMFVQSNDWFYTTTGNGDSIALFDENGDAVSGDFSTDLALWESGTEEDEPAGTGPNQAPRQSAANTGTPESSTVGSLADRGTTVQLTGDVVRFTITSITAQ